MALGPNLSQRLATSQTLALTPAMQLKLKLWQMNLVELKETIDQEVLENPLLEIEEEEPDLPGEVLDEGQESESSRSLDDFESVEVETQDLSSLLESTGEMDPEGHLEAFTSEAVAQVQETELGPENLWDGELPRTSNLPDEDRMSWEDRLSATVSLQEHLVSQIYEVLDPGDPLAELAELLVDHLDVKGFLRLDPDEAVETNLHELSNHLGRPSEDMRAAVDLLQEFDPPGIACFNLQESFLLQLRHAGVEPDDLAVTIIRQHVDLLIRMEHAKLRKVLDCSEEDLQLALEMLRHLHPAPGRAFDSETERVVKPDVVAIKDEEAGIWKVYLNDDGLPRLKVNSEYRSYLAASDKPEDRRYIKDKFRSAREFIRGVEDRNRTVLRVSMAIVELQMDFLENGVEGLRPMVLRDVAEATGFHESTVSRVVKAKTIYTPQGLFDLNYFFSASLGSSSGDDVSSTVVKHKIKAYIQAEDAAHPLSDETIAKLLDRDGIHVARRTVNKYREEMKIPPASKRRRR